MKNTFLSILFLLSINSFASNSQLINTLENALSFQGYVEIDKVTNVGEYTIVELYVGAYGEERPTKCILKNDILLDCTDNWFNL